MPGPGSTAGRSVCCAALGLAAWTLIGCAPAATAAGPDGTYLADHQVCARCHAETHAQWSTSAHRFASLDNPIYRVAFDRFRREVGAKESVFCGRCHDPALVQDGLLDAPGAIDLDDPRARAGVTCQVCHGIESATRLGNGSYVLRSDRIFLPDPQDEASVERHRQEARPIAGVDLCGSCHRGFLSPATGNPAVLAGMDDLGPWGESVFAGTRLDRMDSGPVPRQACRDCHMPAEDGRASHRFLGGHTWLAAIRGDDDTVGRVRRFLEGVADLDIAIDGMTLTVGVRNVRVGHRFPGGVRDAQDTRLQVVAYDAGGEVLWTDERHRLTAWVTAADGQVVTDRATHLFRAPVADHTVPPGATRLARYHLPEATTRVSVKLLHRSRSGAIAHDVCALESRGCVPMPVTTIAERELSIQSLPPVRPAGFALAFLAGVQERGGDAGVHAEGAGPYERGRVLARLGRTDEALAQWALAAAHPAIARASGRALAAVWRFDEAIPFLREAVRVAPESISAARDLAVATASAGRPLEGLETGLILAPRDATLLRVKALATGHPDDVELWQAHRGPDELDALKQLCARRSTACSQARMPIPELRPPGPIAMQPR